MTMITLLGVNINKNSSPAFDISKKFYFNINFKFLCWR